SEEGPEDGPLSLDDHQAIAMLRQVLEGANYSAAGIQEALGISDEFSFRRPDAPVYLRRLPTESTLSTLIKLFLLGVTVDSKEATGSLEPLSVKRLEAVGLIEGGPDGVRSQVRIMSFGGLLFAYDRYDDNPSHFPPDCVIGVNPTSKTLASLTVRRPVQSALDLGTGCGVLALLAARHSDHVVAADINARALNVAAFNARLNGISHVECRRGSLFEPVEGRQFDLIVCNPPYVISPDSQYQYRDSGLPGDSICQEIVRQTPNYLNKGGFAHVLCNWVRRRDEDWSEPLREWVEGSGCDAWLLHYKTEDPLTYAANWNRPLQSSTRDAYPSALDHWLDYYRRLGIEAISSGAIILRRRTAGPNWVRADDLPSGSVGPSSDHILRVFEAQDYLSGLGGDEALMEEAFCLVEHHRLDQSLKFNDGKFVMQEAMLRLEKGLKFQGKLDAYTVHLLSHCDGHQPLGDLIAELALVMGLDLSELTSAVIPVVRKLIGLGFLEPARPTRR
ncbi:MAG: methyltransferase, partial [Dehalococcoidia bacterium]